jgi:hypothetical protein
VHTHKGSIIIAGSDDAVLKSVAANRGAIGIVDLFSLTKDIKVLTVDGKLPVEQASPAEQVSEQQIVLYLEQSRASYGCENGHGAFSWRYFGMTITPTI